MADICSENLCGSVVEDVWEPWSDSPGIEATPFVHRFETENQKYFFDVNTLRILRVSPVVWDIIEDFGRLSEAEMIDRYCPPYHPEQIKAAREKITHTQENDGLLLPNRPTMIVPPPKEMIAAKLRNHREQLILDVTEQCNFRCRYCLFDDGKEDFRDHSDRNMSWEVAQKAMEEFLQHSREPDSRAISFYGGEPLLNLPLIRQCVKYIRQRYDPSYIRFTITTNGSLLCDEAAAFLAEEDFTVLLSLDGPRAIHDAYRRTQTGDPTWEWVTSNVRRFLETYPKYKSNGHLRFNAVTNASTDLCHCQTFWEKSEFLPISRGLQISSQKEGSGKFTTIPLDSTFVRSAETLYNEFLQQLKDGYFNDEHENTSTWVQAAIFENPLIRFHKRGSLPAALPETMRFLNHCIPGARRTFVSVDGEYYACERVSTCQKLCIGNVETGVELERVMALIRMWMQANQEQCHLCWSLPICFMGCLAYLGSENGVSAEEKKKACSLHRKITHRLIRDYCRVLESNPKAFDYAAKVEIQ